MALTGTPLTLGFDVLTPGPIEKNRFLFNDLADLLALNTNWRYPAMRCFVIDAPDRGYYELIGTVNILATHNDNWVKVEATAAVIVNDRGNWDASTAAFPTTGGSGESGAIQKGDLWFISVAGTINGIAYTIGDQIRARIDSPGPTNNDWRALEGNLGYVPENQANKVTNLTSPNHDNYPTTQAVSEALTVLGNAKEPATTIATVAGATYTLVLADAAKLIMLTGTAAQLITLPKDSTAAIPINTKVRFAGNSNFAKTFAAEAGATVISVRGLLMDGFKGFVYAEKIAADTWFLSGDLIEPIITLTTSGTVTINTQVCNRLILDMEGKEWKKFKYIGDDTWLGIDIINRVDGSQFILDIERSNANITNCRFVQYTELYADTQIIDGAQLLLKGKATGRTLAKIGGHITTYSAGTNAGLVNTITYLERTNIGS